MADTSMHKKAVKHFVKEVESTHFPNQNLKFWVFTCEFCKEEFSVLKEAPRKDYMTGGFVTCRGCEDIATGKHYNSLRRSR